MQLFKSIFLFILFSLIQKTAVSEVLVQEGSFRHSLSLFNRGPKLKIYYSNHSQHQGVFGFLWCAEFEEETILRNGITWRKDCLQGKYIQVTKRPTQFAPKTMPNWLKIMKTKKGLILDNGYEKVNLHIKNGFLERVDQVQSQQYLTYDSRSNLIEINETQKIKPTLSPSRSSPNSQTQKITIKYDHQDRVLQIKYPNQCLEIWNYTESTENWVAILTKICPLKKKEIRKYVIPQVH